MYDIDPFWFGVGKLLRYLIFAALITIVIVVSLRLLGVKI